MLSYFFQGIKQTRVFKATILGMPNIENWVQIKLVNVRGKNGEKSGPKNQYSVAHAFHSLVVCLILRALEC